MTGCCWNWLQDCSFAIPDYAYSVRLVTAADVQRSLFEYEYSAVVVAGVAQSLLPPVVVGLAYEGSVVLVLVYFHVRCFVDCVVIELAFLSYRRR